MSDSLIIDFSDEGFERLKAVAAYVGQSPMDFIREAVQERIEDIEDVVSAEAVLAKIHSGEMKTYPLEKVRRQLGVED